MGECSFWYRPTRVVADQRPLNGRCRCCCCYSLFYGFSHTVTSSLLQMFAGGPKITVTPLDRTSHPIIIISSSSSSSSTQEKKKKRKLQVTINKNYNVHT